MRFKLSLALLAVALLVSASARTPRQEQTDDEQVVEDFVLTRGAIFLDPPAKKSSTRPKPRANNEDKVAGKRPAPRPAANPPRKQGKGSSTAAGGADAELAKQQAPDGGGAAHSAQGGQTHAGGAALTKASAQPIGLGYTLYRVRGFGGEEYVPVDPSEVFRDGDQVRFSLETNTDGYLYIFNTTDGADPEMLYPHVSVEGGQNRIAAHRLEPVPASGKGFQFADNPGTERLFVVVSRRPLAGVPTGEELLAHCRGSSRCEWKPTGAQWSRLESLFRQGGRVRQGQTQLAQLKPVKGEMLTRGLNVAESAPRPAVVRINDSPDADLLVTVIDLVHK